METVSLGERLGHRPVLREMKDILEVVGPAAVGTENLQGENKWSKENLSISIATKPFHSLACGVELPSGTGGWRAEPGREGPRPPASWVRTTARRGPGPFTFLRIKFPARPRLGSFA